MSKTIEGVPEYITRGQYLALFAACGFEPSQIVELRMAHEGVHALVFALDADGKRRLDFTPGEEQGGHHKHRVFIPVRHEADDARTTRVTDVTPLSREQNR